MQFKLIATLFIATVFLQGCWKPAGSWKNDQISASKRSDFHDLDDQLLKYLKADDYISLKTIESREIIENGSGEKEVDEISNLFRKSDYKLADEYYVVNKYKDFDTVLNHSKSINNYNVLYRGGPREMYIAFFVPKTKTDNEWLIGAMFYKLNYGWKLSVLDFGMYKIDGKTAPELCETAGDEYNKHYLVNAANYIQLAHSIERPVAMYAYAMEDSINNAYWRIAAEATAKTKFPIVLNDVATHPHIFKIFEGEFNDGYYPKIYYQTSINVSDTNAIRKENNEIMQALPKVIPGIDKDSPWLLFTAFNKLPNVQESVPRYEMDNRLK